MKIKPGSYPNSINLSSKGPTPVAIFGSGTFDVHQINLNSITLAGASIKSKKNGQLITSYKDINNDGIIDVIIHIATENLQLTVNDVKADLRGFLFDDREIRASDSVRVVQ